MEFSTHYLLMADHAMLQKLVMSRIKPLGLTTGQPKVLDFLQNQRQEQQHRHEKHKRARKRDDRRHETIRERGKQRGRENTRAHEQEADRINRKAVHGNLVHTAAARHE